MRLEIGEERKILLLTKQNTSLKPKSRWQRLEGKDLGTLGYGRHGGAVHDTVRISSGL